MRQRRGAQRRCALRTATRNHHARCCVKRQLLHRNECALTRLLCAGNRCSETLPSWSADASSCRDGLRSAVVTCFDDPLLVFHAPEIGARAREFVSGEGVTTTQEHCATLSSRLTNDSVAVHCSPRGPVQVLQLRCAGSLFTVHGGVCASQPKVATREARGRHEAGMRQARSRHVAGTRQHHGRESNVHSKYSPAWSHVCVIRCTARASLLTTRK